MATLSLLFLLLLIIAFRCAADLQKKDDLGVVEGGELWCVAKNNAEDAALQVALDWACGPGGADCRPIQEGGQCFSPDDIQSHASYAFNDYFLRNGFQLSACDFGGTAAPISLDPSHDNCTFPSSSSARNGSFSGSTMGSTAGLGPAGADMSGAIPLQLKISTWPLTLSFSMAILTTAVSSIFR